MSTQEPTIRRGVRNARYSTIPNQVLEDARLSMDARWLLCYLLSKPDNWIARIRDIRNVGGCGRDKATAMVNELITAGYAEREQLRETGKFGNTVLVIYDEPRQAEQAENQPVGGSVASLPQPDLPDTAEPDTVLPGPANPTPSKDLEIANTDSSNLREGASEGSEKAEDGRASERMFKRGFAAWPTFVSDSEPAARKAWDALTIGKQHTAIEREPDYIAMVRASGRSKFCTFGVYLAEERWEKLPANPIASELPKMAAPFGKAWGAMRLAMLLKRPATLPGFTPLELRIIEQSPDKEPIFIRDKRLKFGWPAVVTMHERAAGHQPRGVPATPEAAGLGENFHQAEVGGALWEAWKALHAARGWPFMPEPSGQRWVWFPAIDDGETDLSAAVERALDAFRGRIEGNVGAAA